MRTPSTIHATGTSGLDKIPDRTEAKAREDIARRDRQGWFSFHHHVMRHGSTSVAFCPLEKDCDQIVLMAKSHDAMLAALENLLNGFETGMIDSPADDLLANGMKQARTALALARGATALKTADQVAGEPGAFK